jgi:hypothetical protein
LPLEVVKQRKETSPALVRRFIKRLRQSGLLRRAKKIRFKTRAKSDVLKKRTALKKVLLKKEQERLRKLGKTASVYRPVAK